MILDCKKKKKQKRIELVTKPGKQKADVPTSVLLDLTSSSEDEEDLMLKPP